LTPERQSLVKKSQPTENHQKRARLMKPPRIPPLVTDIIQTALSSLDGLEFTEIIACPSCGGTLQGYDSKKKKFAVLRETTGERVITVRIKRFRCRSCGSLCYADEPFYPGTRIGSPVIDIFSSLSATMPRGRAARIIDTMGIVVNRTTWRNYSVRPLTDIPVVDVFGMRLPLCIVKLSDIGVNTGESYRPNPVDVIAACGYPSRSTGMSGSPVEYR
jgi:hypothetical protein